MSLKDLGNPTISTYDQEVNVEASISGLPGPSYFRVEWQKSSGDTYFGDMKVGEGWVQIDAVQDCKNYLYVPDVNTTSLSFLTRIGENGRLVSGNYGLKLRRYTPSCASHSDSDLIGVTLNLPSPSPASTPSPTHVPIPTPTKTPSPTSVKTANPTLLPSLKPTPKKSTTPDQTPTPSDSSDVLGIGSTLVLPSSQTDATKSGQTKVRPEFLGFTLISLGALFVGSSVFIALRTPKSSEAQNDI